jgi:drug/metabolite transporter (DMT)-like permease
MLDHDLSTAAFGLAAALAWGAGDFSGGLASRYAPILRVLIFTQVTGLGLLVGLAWLWGEPLPPTAGLLWGAAAGLLGLCGVAALYRALAIGQMGLAAPISALLAAVLPVLFGMATEGLPGWLRLLGFGVALGGVWLVSRPDGAGGQPRGVGMAVLSGCAFGAYFIVLDRAGEAGIFWPLVAGRLVSFMVVLALALLRRERLPPPAGMLLLLLLPAVLEIIGNTCFVLATRAGRLDVAAVLSSLYPASTVLLARIVLGERLSQAQTFGVGAVLAAIVLITV